MGLDSEGGAMPTDPMLTPGQSVLLKAPGFVADETVTATVYSTPQVLGTTAADSAGLVSYSFVVPTGLAQGSHTLQFAGASLRSDFAFHLGENPVPVISTSGVAPTVGTLAKTGSNTVPFLLTGLFLLWAGAMLVLHVGPSAGNARHGALSSRGRHALS